MKLLVLMCMCISKGLHLKLVRDLVAKQVTNNSCEAEFPRFSDKLKAIWNWILQMVNLNNI